MTPESFCYWLQGFMELEGIGTKDDMEGVHPEQAKIIRDHLNLVFEKKTPTHPKPSWGGEGSGGGTRYCTAKEITEELKDLPFQVSC